MLLSVAEVVDRELKLLGELSMKKHLIAVALAAAVAVPAMAQNVSIYGTADVSVTRTDTAGGVTTNIIDNGRFASSVLGLRGSEDLGGGLKAEFQLEGAMNFNTGVLGAAGGAVFGREAWVGLSSTTMGSIRFGKTDVSAAQGVDGVISVAGNLSDFTADLATGSDQDDVVRYTSPTINGFTFDIGQALTSTAAAKGTTDTTGYSIRYAAGPFDVRAGRIDTDVVGAIKNSQTAVGGSYNAGFATIGLARNKVKSATANTAHTETGVSISAPLGGGLTALAALTDMDRDTAAANDPKQTIVGVRKALSKRTSVYGVYMDTNNSDATADKKEYLFGLTHTF